MSDPIQCPYCGGDALVYVAPEYYKVGCRCSAMVGPFDTEEEAIAAWNRRPPARMYTLEELRERNGEKICIRFIGAGKGLLEDIVAPYFGKYEQYIKEYNGILRATDLPLQYYDTDWAAYDRPPEGE